MRGSRGLFLAVLVASCARAPAPAPKGTLVQDTSPTSSAPSAASSSLPSAPGVPKTTARYGDSEIEIACNGIDDDGDGLTDVLLPVAPNACDTGLRGACAKGFAACEDGKRVCLAPPPMPEVADGIDNDCNGTVDDVADRAVHPRALLVAPKYAWTDAAPDIATVAATLAQAGIPFDKQTANTDWQTSLGTLDGYALVLVPGYLIASSVTADAKKKLEEFADRGGVVVVWKPVGSSDQKSAWELTGLNGATRHRDVAEIRFEAASPATAAIDSVEERRLRINAHVSKDSVEVWALEPDGSTETIARAYVGNAAVGAAITRRRVGKGSIYAVGHDLATFDASRCYVNCFEPSGDVMRLMLEGALREGAGGHVVLKHSAPSEASSVLVLTHDVDAPDSQNDGEWGEAGAIQAAKIEKARGVRATFNITTDYVAGYFNPKTLKDLCALGMCPLGLHSVIHSDKFNSLPFGTCQEERGTYGKSPTLCGEIRVSRDILHDVTAQTPRVWRAPFLLINPRQFDALAQNGIVYDSGFGVGDLPYNLPIDLAAVGFHQNRFHHAPLFEFPVACEDGIDSVDNGKHLRVELQESNRLKFVALWRYILLENAHNKSFTTLLMHPSRGRGMPTTNVGVKIAALDRFLGEIAKEDVAVRPLEEIGDFWRARLDAALDATFEAGVYKGSIHIGKTTAPGMTLEFGDAITTFDCATCGETKIKGKRVVIVNALPPGTKASFVATASAHP